MAVFQSIRKIDMKHSVQIILYLCFGMMMSGCTNLSAFIANIPTYFDDTKIYKNVVFKPEYNLALDVYVPSPATPLKSEAIVFFYGGSWESGDKGQYKFLASAMAKQGYVVFVPNYRHYPDVKFPEFMFDAADAVKWVKIHGSEYSGNQKSIIVMGHSAGANIATLLLTDKNYLKEDNKAISAGIGLSGAYDFTPNTDHLKDIFGPPDKYPLMRPAYFVDGHEPPLFLAYGGKDNIVAPFNLENMRLKLKEKNVCAVTKIYPSFDHIDTIAKFSWVGGRESIIFKDVIQFLNDVSNHNLCKNYKIK